MSDNEFETTENKNETKDNIELKHIQQTYPQMRQLLRTLTFM